MTDFTDDDPVLGRVRLERDSGTPRSTPAGRRTDPHPPRRRAHGPAPSARAPRGADVLVREARRMTRTPTSTPGSSRRRRRPGDRAPRRASASTLGCCGSVRLRSRSVLMIPIALALRDDGGDGDVRSQAPAPSPSPTTAALRPRTEPLDQRRAPGAARRSSPHDDAAAESAAARRPRPSGRRRPRRCRFGPQPSRSRHAPASTRSSPATTGCASPNRRAPI